MKKQVLLFILIFCCVQAYAQSTKDGQWSSIVSTYFNTTHGITWTLNDTLELEWTGRPILGETTIFKAKNEDLSILVTLGVKSSNGQKLDAWDYYEYLKTDEYMSMARAEAKRTGGILRYVKPEKIIASGKHATRVTSDISKYYSEYDLTMHYIMNQVQICHNAYIYTLTVSCLSVPEGEKEDFMALVEGIFKGFSIE